MYSADLRSSSVWATFTFFDSGTAPGQTKPFFSKAWPNSLSCGKIVWQVVHSVLCSRENAGMASARSAQNNARNSVETAKSAPAPGTCEPRLHLSVYPSAPPL